MVRSSVREKESAGELEVLARKYGWEKKPLTFRQVQNISSQELRFHEIYNKVALEKALNSPVVVAENKKNQEVSSAQRFWANQATEHEVAKAQEGTSVFVSRYPQVRWDYRPNIDALNDWLKAKTLPIAFNTLVQAFEDLVRRGGLVLNPSVLGIGTENEVSGYKLMRHPELHRLLEPAPTAEQQAKIADQKLSARDYKDAHAEDFRETRLSDRQQQSWNKAIAFFMESRPDYKPTEANRKKLLEFIFSNGLQVNPQGLETGYRFLKPRNELELNAGAVQEGQSVRYSNLASTGGDVRSGFVGRDTNLAAKIASMSAKDYADWLRSPSNRKAADALAAGIR
jgi:hypothetical protein